MVKSRGRLTSRLGVSAVLGSIILSAFVVVLGLGLWAMTSSTANAFIKQAGTRVGERIAGISSSIIIEYFRIDGSDLYLCLYNNGELDVVVTDVIFIDSEGSFINQLNPRYIFTLKSREEVKCLTTSVPNGAARARVYAIPAAYFDVDDPLKNFDIAVTAELKLLESATITTTTTTTTTENLDVDVLVWIRVPGEPEVGPLSYDQLVQVPEDVNFQVRARVRNVGSSALCLGGSAGELTISVQPPFTLVTPPATRGVGCIGQGQQSNFITWVVGSPSSTVTRTFTLEFNGQDVHGHSYVEQFAFRVRTHSEIIGAKINLWYRICQAGLFCSSWRDVSYNQLIMAVEAITRVEFRAEVENTGGVRLCDAGRAGIVRVSYSNAYLTYLGPGPLDKGVTPCLDPNQSSSYMYWRFGARDGTPPSGTQVEFVFEGEDIHGHQVTDSFKVRVRIIEFD